MMVTNRTKTLYHVTLDENWFSIVRRGLLLKFARDEKSVWLVSRSRVKWAIRHVQERYNAPGHAVIIFKVRVRRSWLRRARRGIWACERSIPAKSIEEWYVTEEWK